MRRTTVRGAVLLCAALAAGCGRPAPVVGPPEHRDARFAAVDRLLEDFRARGAFPGGVLAVGHQGSLVHLHAFGRLTYEATSPAVEPSTLYDLASLTKARSSYRNTYPDFASLAVPVTLWGKPVTFQLYDGLVQHKLFGLHQIRYGVDLLVYALEL